MDSRQKKKALHIMDIIKTHPIFNSFFEPFDEDFPPNYYRIIGNSKDLGTIQENLIQGKYNSVESWINEVNSIWDNAEKYYEKTRQNFPNNEHFAKTFVDTARFSKKIFDKLTIEMRISSYDVWRKEVYHLRTKIFDFLALPPGKIRQEAASILPSHLVKQNFPPLTEKQVHQFVQATEMISNSDRMEMIKIIDELQPEIDNGGQELHIDVNKLNPSTVYTLRDFLRASLGSKYPE